jgi:hypothetical protein
MPSTDPQSVDHGSRRAPVDTSPPPQPPAPGHNGPPIKARGSRPVQYPIQLKVNLSPAMAASLKKVCRRLGMPEGIGARIAIANRLREMENAERSVRETPPQREESFAQEPQQQPQQRPVTMEQIIADAPIPERAKAWLRQHPDYMTDPVKNARITKMHHVAEYQAGGTAYSEDYFQRLEELLGIRAKPNGNGIPKPAAQRSSAPSPQRQSGSSPQVSAPPTRQAPSMTTGRPAGQPMQLTHEEHQLARALKLSPEEYAENKQKMIALKNVGVIQDGR